MNNCAEPCSFHPDGLGCRCKALDIKTLDEDLNDAHVMTLTGDNSDLLISPFPNTYCNGRTVCIGDIQLNSPLNYEDVNEYNVTVRVVDAGQLATELRVQIFVSDVNEPPTFADKSSLMALQIPENAAVGDVVGTFVVQTNAATKFSLKSMLEAFDFVDVSSAMHLLLRHHRQAAEVRHCSIAIVVNEALDFEMKKTYDFQITIRDRSDPSSALWTLHRRDYCQ